MHCIYYFMYIQNAFFDIYCFVRTFFDRDNYSFHPQINQLQQINQVS